MLGKVAVGVKSVSFPREAQFDVSSQLRYRRVSRPIKTLSTFTYHRAHMCCCRRVGRAGDDLRKRVQHIWHVGGAKLVPRRPESVAHRSYRNGLPKDGHMPPLLLEKHALGGQDRKEELLGGR